ncbi:MAG: anhydro-N-acetylmuramic acid kinase [Gammaproteobacteria bacterium]
MPDYFIGLMSGTSIDGIDAALVDFSASPRLISFAYLPYPDQVKKNLNDLCQSGKNLDVGAYGALDCQVGHLFADCALNLLDIAGIPGYEIKALGSHGQTIFHAPNIEFPFSLQIGDPNIIAEKTGITTVADFRRRDIAAGGQGAPLVPAFHQIMLDTADENRVIVNIGGVANITVLPGRSKICTFGFDTGPGNSLLDLWIQKNLGLPYDKNGDWSFSGTENSDFVDLLKQDDYFSLPPPKSTGREYFSLKWLERKISAFPRRLPPEDIQASLCRLTAETVCAAIKRHAPEADCVFICGGGFHNDLLLRFIQQSLDIPVESTGKLGVDPDHVEAMAFAWLAKQTMEGRPGNLKEVTGAKRPVILGGVYPGKSN